MENEALQEAIEIIDKALKEISGREIVSTTEMSDLLLDMRLLLQTAG
jgi:hypothetical protein